MGFLFVYKPNRALPRLAWVVEVDGRTGVLTVQHGEDVETTPQFFIEGAWNGCYQEGAFAQSDCIFGSGATLKAPHPTFVSSASTTDYLYYGKRGSNTVVANSLPLLLAHTGCRLDPSYERYDAINDSIQAGIHEYIAELPTHTGTVRRLMYHNLEIRDGEPVERGKQDEAPHFRHYAEYTGYLEECYAGLVGNLRDRGRRKWRIISTQSRGYDTTAVNAIAVRYGLDAVFTITKGKAAGHFADDSTGAEPDDDGTEICRTLGAGDIVVPIDRREFERQTGKEHLFYATLHSSQDENFLGIGDRLEGPSLLLSGTLGEMWYPQSPYYEEHPGLSGPDLRRVDLGTHGLTEFRLESGFVHLPFPYIGARRRDEVDRITASEEMLPWHVKGFYNRPIPRRMAEEAGVPREMFGQQKMATVIELRSPIVPRGAELREQYHRFLVENGILPEVGWRMLPTIRRINGVIHMHRLRSLYYFERAVSKASRRDYRMSTFWTALNGRIFCFCVNQRADWYAAMLA